MENLNASRRRRRRTTTPRADSPKFPFDKLPKEIALDIYRKLPVKELAKAMCVSKPWREHILSFLPSLAPVALHYLGLLMYLDSDTQSCKKSSGIKLAISGKNCHRVGRYNLLGWCSRVMQCRTTARMLLDCCNGLLLFCHREGKAQSLLNAAYYYYVLNPSTKQCVAVLKPGQDNCRFMYAALAYDPAESSFFKIVQFRGCSKLNVFSSETGEWVTLKSQLPQDVTRANWLKKSVYHKKAVYRVSDSGHLLRFCVDPQENVCNQAVAINLPTDDRCLRRQNIGVQHKKIVFAMTEESSILVWELHEQFHEQGVCTFYWTLKKRVKYQNLRAFCMCSEVIAIHPYYELLFFLFSSKVYFCYYSAKGMIIRRFQKSSTDDSFTALPFLQCSIPFTCCLDKKTPGILERISAPRIRRRLQIAAA